MAIYCTDWLHSKYKWRHRNDGAYFHVTLANNVKRLFCSDDNFLHSIARNTSTLSWNFEWRQASPALLNPRFFSFHSSRCRRHTESRTYFPFTSHITGKAHSPKDLHLETTGVGFLYRQMPFPINRVNPFNGHTKTGEQRTIIQPYGDWYTGRWWVDCYVWYSEDGTGRGPSSPRPLLAVPNVTAHPSTASVSTSYYSIWHYHCLWILKA